MTAETQLTRSIRVDNEACARVAQHSKPVLVDQVLEDGRGLALQAQLGFDEIAVGFAQGGSHRCRGSNGSRCPGGNLRFQRSVEMDSERLKTLIG